MSSVDCGWGDIKSSCIEKCCIEKKKLTLIKASNSQKWLPARIDYDWESSMMLVTLIAI